VPKCSEGLRKSSGKLEKLFSSFLRGASCPKSPRVAATAAKYFYSGRVRGSQGEVWSDNFVWAANQLLLSRFAKQQARTIFKLCFVRHFAVVSTKCVTFPAENPLGQFLRILLHAAGKARFLSEDRGCAEEQRRGVSYL